MYGLIFERQDGSRYYTRENNIDVKEFNPPGPSYITERVVMETFDGEIDMGSTLGRREIPFQLFLKCSEYGEYILKRNEFVRFVSGKQEIFVIDERHKTVRWPVKIEGLSVMQKGGAPMADIGGTFVCSQGVSESLATTQDPLFFETNLWSLGQNIPNSEDIRYKFNTNRFRVYNASDVLINPERYPLVIRYKGMSEGLTIANQTTGQSWTYTGTTREIDIIELNQVYPLLNGANVYKDTSKSEIWLLPGWNDFVITGSTGPLEILFDFRFYYYM
ncbi:phage tail domain-containing protein [Listeria booriae]|uniref:Phage tail family protein n=1 Tax=Listeria booriae TaxID=1552123 RepID=A0A841WG39_9LIST|nr:phage tail domain-containing protein [Listeria booriae]MBC1231486.1 phage tail family protein [Listeria booriae]MBC1801128.1 phage tail family protein [Listeria booriae]MBC2239751.1 phage tail family protein [Listeria booriae]